MIYRGVKRESIVHKKSTIFAFSADYVYFLSTYKLVELNRLMAVEIANNP